VTTIYYYCSTNHRNTTVHESNTNHKNTTIPKEMRATQISLSSLLQSTRPFYKEEGRKENTLNQTQKKEYDNK
jgi:deoxycytidine triphosphate deaminase